MARLFTCGFELQDLDVELGVSHTGTLFGPPALSTSVVRGDGKASLRCNPSTDDVGFSLIAGTLVDTIWLRSYIRIASAPVSDFTTLMYIYSVGEGINVIVYINTDRTLSLYMWDDVAQEYTQQGSDSSALDTDTWYRIEVYADTSGTTWTSTGYIDGSEFATGTEVNGFTADCDGIALEVYRFNPATFQELGASADIYYDDMAWNDDSGSDQNGLPGAGSVALLLPNAAGDNSDGDSGPSGSQPIADMISTFDEATSYWILDTNSDTIDVNMQAPFEGGIGVGDDITLVQVGVRQRPATASTAAFAPRIKSEAAGTTTTGTSQTHNDTTWKSWGDATGELFQLTSYADPEAAGVWTPALLTTAQIGIICTDAAPDLWVSSLWATVEYVDNNEDITERGFAWHTSSHGDPGDVAPGASDYSTGDVGETGNFPEEAFTGSITGLSGSTTYYYRAYAQNEHGYGWGDEENFTTTGGASTAVKDVIVSSGGVVPFAR